MVPFQIVVLIIALYLNETQVQASLTFSGPPSSKLAKSNYSVYGLLWWNRHRDGNETLFGLRVVNMLHDRQLFDYCDPTLFTKEGTSELLSAHGINSSTPVPFMALFHRFDLFNRCKLTVLPTGWRYTNMKGKDIYIDFDELLPERQSIWFQKIGAATVVTATRFVVPFNFFYEGIDYLDGVVDGVKSTTPVYGLFNPFFDELMRENVDFTVNKVYANITASEDAEIEFLHSPGSAVSLVAKFIAFIFVSVALVGTFMLFLEDRYRNTRNKASRVYRSLLLSMLNGLAFTAAVSCFDPAGLFYYVSFTTAVTAISAYFLFNWFVVMAFLLLWVDLRRGISQAVKETTLKGTTNAITTPTFGKVFYICLTIVIAELLVHVLSLLGVYKTNEHGHISPVVYGYLVSINCVACFIVSIVCLATICYVSIKYPSDEKLYEIEMDAASISGDSELELSPIYTVRRGEGQGLVPVAVQANGQRVTRGILKPSNADLGRGGGNAVTSIFHTPPGPHAVAAQGADRVIVTASANTKVYMREVFKMEVHLAVIQKILIAWSVVLLSSVVVGSVYSSVSTQQRADQRPIDTYVALWALIIIMASGVISLLGFMYVLIFRFPL